jgi:hypothetical protein
MRMREQFTGLDGAPEMPQTITVESVVYLPSRRCEVRCRLWYEVTRLENDLQRYFLLRVEELE